MDRLISLALLGLSLFTPTQATTLGDFTVAEPQLKKQILAQKTLNLATRHPDPWVNQVFSDNILLNLHYLKDDIEAVKDEKGRVDWEKVRQPFEFSFTLVPGQTFAYHRNLLPEFKDKDATFGQSRFWFDEGYKSDGYLVADGVCHLASLFNWVASTAGLEVKSTVNHDFLPVPEVPREFGTSIFYSPDGGRNTANQNLYLTNNFSYPVEFEISADHGQVEIQIVAEIE